MGASVDGQFFLKKIFTPVVYIQNDLRAMAIILRHVCWGTPPRETVYFFSVSFCPCLPGPLGLDKLSPTPPPCPLTT